MSPTAITFDHHRDPSHQVAVIPELVLQIFESLDEKELFSAALICKEWTWMALDTRWRCRAVPLTRLLSKLAPVKVCGSPHNKVRTSLGRSTLIPLTSEPEVLRVGQQRFAYRHAEPLVLLPRRLCRQGHPSEDRRLP